MHQQPSDDTLQEAQETISKQQAEIQQLKQRLQREQFAQEFRTLLQTAEQSATILSPFSHAHVLEMVVATAAQVISALSASLYLIDEDAQDLVFEVALGPVAQEVKKFRVPLGHGIAGVVALTGQSMAIANAERHEHFAIDIATAVNYIPKNILCVPLFYDGRVIGALELFDKIGADTFGLADLETLGVFANIAAVAIAQSNMYHDQEAILHSLIRTFATRDDEQKQHIQSGATPFLRWSQTDDAFSKTTRELAMLVHELALAGQQEITLCKNILEGLVINARNRAGIYGVFSTAQ
ncbi:MAG: GAF domain-containing protein [Ktedonobacteraceae bacterium]|nr:GAF domain-containing protein [Ktedonobacteraceae bacterium]